mgnify:CR=1 FL=1
MVRRCSTEQRRDGRAHLYESLTSKKLVMDNNVQGKVNIFIAKPVPREEAVRIIEMNLALAATRWSRPRATSSRSSGINKNQRAAAVPFADRFRPS